MTPLWRALVAVLGAAGLCVGCASTPPLVADPHVVASPLPCGVDAVCGAPPNGSDDLPTAPTSPSVGWPQPPLPAVPLYPRSTSRWDNPTVWESLDLTACEQKPLEGDACMWAQRYWSEHRDPPPGTEEARRVAEVSRVVLLYDHAVQAMQADLGWSSSNVDTCLAAKTSDACAPLRSYINLNPKGRWANRARQAIRQAAPRIAQLARAEELAKARAAAETEAAAPVEWPPAPWEEGEDPLAPPRWWR